MPRQKVEFSANLPTIIELEAAGMMQANGRGEEEWRYMLQDERITWVPPAVHAAIVATGNFHPGATFEITKHQLKARAPITWEVQRVDPPAGYGYSATPAPQPPPVSAPRPQRELRSPAHAAYADAQRAQADDGPGSSRQPFTAAQAAAYHAPQPAAQLAADAPELATTPADRYAAALRDAIDLIRGAQQYEPAMQWTAADARAIAATLFIGGGK